MTNSADSVRYTYAQPVNVDFHKVNFLWFLRFHLAAVTLSASYLSIDNDKWIKMKDTIHWDGPLL